MKNYSCSQIICLSLILLSLTGCASRGTALPEHPTMAEVYEDTLRQSNAGTLDEARLAVAPQAITTAYHHPPSNYVRIAENEIDHLFPMLANPEILMYVYPHLASEEEAPIPGYTTAFSLFEKNHYALPGE